MIKSFLILLLLLLFSCSTPQNGIDQLLPVIQLQSGKSDTLFVPDLFYTRDYTLNVQSNNMILAVYDAQSRQLALTPKAGHFGWTSLSFVLDGKKYDLPVRIERRVPVTLKYKAASPTDVVQVIGSFNTWDRHSAPMTDKDGNGVFSKTFYLRPGRYEYRFYVNRKERIDPKNPDKILNPFGEYNSLLTVRGPAGNPPEIYNERARKKREKFYFDFSLQNIPDSVRVFAWLNNRRLNAGRYKVQAAHIHVTLDKDQVQRDGILRIAIQGKSRASNLQVIDFNPLFKKNMALKDRSWYDAIAYSIIVDRFKDGDPANTQKIKNNQLPDKSNYYGGDLQGVLDEIDAGYFSNLGVNVLWLSPVVQNPFEAYREYPEPHRFTSGYHGYWPIASDKVDVRFGDMALLRKLVDHAHAKNIRVILDFVSNHVHIKHPWYHEHRDWFGSVDLPDGRKNLRLWDEFRLTTWFETFLPAFDYPGSDAAVQAMTDNALWWLKESGVDGFRQDAVKHVPRKFWRTLTRKIREEIEIPEKRRVYQIGESFGSDKLIRSYIGNGLLDAQFNFNLYDAAIYSFTNPVGSFADLDAALHKSIAVYGTHTLMGNIMDSHDKVRFLALADGDVGHAGQDPVTVGWDNPPVVDNPQSYALEKVYLAYMLSAPGLPFIYYGDEIGMTGAADPDNRRPMRFGKALKPVEQDMLKSVKNLIALRNENSALRYGDFHPLLAEKDVYAYVRSDVRQKLLVVLNKSARQLEKVFHLKGFEKTKHLIPLSKVYRYVYDGRELDMTLPAYSAQFFLLKDE